MPQINSDPSNAGPDPSSQLTIGVHKPTGVGGAIIPGPAQPNFIRRANQVADRPVGPLKFVRMLKSRFVGDRVLSEGDVLKVSDIPLDPHTGRPVQVNIMPVLPLLLQDRAQKLVETGQAEPHGGPATVELGSSMDLQKVMKDAAGQEVEQSMMKPGRGEQATAAPQRRGAM